MLLETLLQGKEILYIISGLCMEATCSGNVNGSIAPEVREIREISRDIRSLYGVYVLGSGTPAMLMETLLQGIERYYAISGRCMECRYSGNVDVKHCSRG